MNILTSHNSPYFGTSTRSYVNPMRNLHTGNCIYTTTCLFRDDLPVDKIVDYAIKEFKGKQKVNIECLAGSDGSEAYSYGIMILNKLGKKGSERFSPILSLDRDLETINSAKTGRINLSPLDIEKSKVLSSGKEYFVDPKPHIHIKDNMIDGDFYKSYEPIPELKGMVRFERGNLIDRIKTFEDEGNSIINCRNVMPYLHPSHVGDIAYYANKNLKSGSLFVIGNFDYRNTDIDKYMNYYNFVNLFHNVYRKY